MLEIGVGTQSSCQAVVLKKKEKISDFIGVGYSVSTICVTVVTVLVTL